MTRLSDSLRILAENKQRPDSECAIMLKAADEIDKLTDALNSTMREQYRKPRRCDKCPGTLYHDERTVDWWTCDLCGRSTEI